jgi:hypothetical protein
VNEHGIVVVGTRWRTQLSELSMVTRSLAAAASRWAPVSVLVPGNGAQDADGAFDLHPMGEDGEVVWPQTISPDSAVIVDELTPDVATLLYEVEPRAVFYVSASHGNRSDSWRQLPVVENPENAHPYVSTYIPVNPLAKVHRHNGFGFTNYLLVLSDGTGRDTVPPPAAAWLTAAFHSDDVIVVQQAVASAWRGRALRGRVSVDTRMDLWRLMAHAKACIDLAPGRIVARECVEALRFGTPIVVPRVSGPAVAHAFLGGGATFGDAQELLDAVAAIRTDDNRSAVSHLGRDYADANHGDPLKFVNSLRAILSDATA